ncbi:hypothetical protein [Bacteroides sp.]|uniref:hypothetical protein n=1 Tax=Bacteroides sp. TaxID=29523 RepID=UPI00261FFBC8|nr:hypothetical protein [Bacteroides sp.]MDD3040312.1 hypothetical protein [Bacteroides sp.]
MMITVQSDRLTIRRRPLNGLPGEIGPIAYPEGEYDAAKTYTRTATTTPIVLRKDNYYYLGVVGSVKGADPATDSRWVKMNKLLYTFIEILFSNFAKLGSAVFSGDFMFSQQGVDYNGLVTSDYQYFNNESFDTNIGNWLVEKPVSIITEALIIGRENEIMVKSGTVINKGEHTLATRGNGTYGNKLRFSYTGDPGTCQFRYYYKTNVFVQILPEGIDVPPCENGYVPNIKVFSPYDSNVNVIIKKEVLFTPNIQINWATGEIKGNLGTFKNTVIENSIISKCKITDVLIQGASKISNQGSSKTLLFNNFIVFDNNSKEYPVLTVPNSAYENGFDLTLNAPVEFKIMNISNSVVSVLFSSQNNISICKAFKDVSFSTVATTSDTIDFNMLSIPNGWLSSLIFIPTSRAADLYLGTWYLLDSNNYQLYYHPDVAITNYKYEMVPIVPNGAITK